MLNEPGTGNNENTNAESLCQILASTYVLYLKTQSYHWNVTGHSFAQLHELFEKQYLELATFVDDLAERVRALGYRAPGSFKEFQRLSYLSEDESADVPSAAQMVRNLMDDHRKISKDILKRLPDYEHALDIGTADLLTGQLKAHEKTSWMLSSVISAPADINNFKVA